MGSKESNQTKDTLSGLGLCHLQNPVFLWRDPYLKNRNSLITYYCVSQTIPKKWIACSIMYCCVTCLRPHPPSPPPPPQPILSSWLGICRNIPTILLSGVQCNTNINFLTHNNQAARVLLDLAGARGWILIPFIQMRSFIWSDTINSGYQGVTG